jgi:hypothetical protein
VTEAPARKPYRPPALMTADVIAPWTLRASATRLLRVAEASGTTARVAPFADALVSLSIELEELEAH